MILPDVNILVYAHRRGATEHDAYRAWLERLINGEQAYAMTDVVLSGFIRVVTNRRVFAVPSTIEQALAFAERLIDQPQCVWARPRARHWSIFARLCRESGATGNLVPDAFLAAIAIEQGCELATTDADFARFKGLRWRHPFA